MEKDQSKGSLSGTKKISNTLNVNDVNSDKAKSEKETKPKGQGQVDSDDSVVIEQDKNKNKVINNEEIPQEDSKTEKSSNNDQISTVKEIIENNLEVGQVSIAVVTPITWLQARVKCKDIKGYDLAVAFTKEDNDAMTQEVRSRGCKEAWIGV